MTSPTSSAQGQPGQGAWSSIAPYAKSALAASIAIGPAVKHLIIKSAQQLGEPTPHVPLNQQIKVFGKIFPTTGGLIAGQMFLQEKVQAHISGDEKPTLIDALESSAVVGVTTSPAVAVFNALVRGKPILGELSEFNLKKAGVISAQESAFVGGIAAADVVAEPVKKVFGDYQLVEYIITFGAGAAGSAAGHWANTILTRMQEGAPPAENLRQLFWGVRRKSYAIGIFACGYKFVKDLFDSGKPKV